MEGHNYSLADLENMIPWEREIYVTLLVEHMKEQKEEMEKRNMRNGNFG